MTKKFAIVLALFVISIVCCAGCIGPGDNEDPEIPDVPDVPDVPDTPVDPVDPVVPVEEYSVMFMLNYGDAGAYTAETVKAGETVSKPANPTRSGYTFKGWFTAAEGGAEYDFTQAVNADVTLYAQWKKKSSGSSHTHVYKTGGQKGSQYGLFCSCGAFKSTGTVDNAIEEAPAGATITLVDSTPATEPIVISKEDNVIIDGAGKEATLQYEDVESIQIKAEGSDHLTVVIPYTKEDNSEGTKTVYLEEVEGKDLLVPAAAVDDENNVGDAYTASGLLAIANMINGDGASGVSLQTDDSVQVLSSAPVGDSVSDSLVLCYEPAMTTLGDEPEAEKPWTITLQADIDLMGKEWTPIGTNANPFTGTFDGQGYTISNLKVTGKENVGFFGYVKGDAAKLKTSISDVYNTEDNTFTSPKDVYTAKIGNFNLVNVDVSGSEAVGAAVGYAESAYIYGITVGTEGSATDSVKGEATGSTKLGGVVGIGYGSFIDNCINNAAISSVNYDDSAKESWNVGGIVGVMRMTVDSGNKVAIISNCKNNGDLTYQLLGAGGLGGICGATSGKSSVSPAGLIIYNSVNAGDITVSSTVAATAEGHGLASGILGTDTNCNTPVIIASSKNTGNIKTDGENAVASLNGILGYNSNAEIIDCDVSGEISGNALAIGGVLAKSVDGGSPLSVSITNTKVSATITNNHEGGVSSDYVADPGNSLVTIKGIALSDELNKALPVTGNVKFDSVTVSGASVTIKLKAASMTLDVTGVSPAKFSIDVSSIGEKTTTTVILPENAEVTLTGTVSTEATLTLKGKDIQVTNNAGMANVGLVIEDAEGANVINSQNAKLSKIKVSGSENVEIDNQGSVANSVTFWDNSNNAVLRNTGTIGSTEDTTTGDLHTIQTSASNNLLVHNLGTILAPKLSLGDNQGYVIHGGSSTGLVLLNYEDAELISHAVQAENSHNNWLFAGIISKLFTCGDSIKYYSTNAYNFGDTFAVNASKITTISIELNAEASDTTDRVKVFANFEDDTKKQQLDHSWLENFNPVEITENTESVNVKFLGKEYTAKVQRTENGEGQSE